jgi:type I restriction enzyme S subunit
MRTATLSELADIQYGFPFDSKHFVKEGEMRIVRIRDIKKPEQPTYFDGDYDEAYVIQNGDIIVGMDGEFNSTLWKHGPALLNQRIARVLPKNSVSKVYLYYMLRVKLKEEEQRITCSTVKHLLDSHLKNIQIPLIPIEAQEKVAQVLEKTDEIKQEREQTNLLANKFLQAVFLQMFGNPITNPYKFMTQYVNELLSQSKHGLRCGPFGSALKKSEFVKSGIPVWNMDNIDNGTFLDTPFLFITPRKFLELRSYEAENGDVIISRAGTVGKMCVVKSKYSQSIISTNLVRLSLNKEKINPVYFIFLMQSSADKTNRLRTGPEGSYTFMNTGVMKKMQIPVPPIELQNKFESIVSHVEQLKEKQTHSAEGIEKLNQSIVSKAFKGELVS